MISFFKKKKPIGRIGFIPRGGNKVWVNYRSEKEKSEIIAILSRRGFYHDK